MAEVKWIKICTDIFDDEKIALIESMPEADGIIVVWFKLLCMAGKQNNGGVFMLNDKIAYTDDMLASIFRRPLNTVRLALSTFEQFGMIEVVNNTYTIPNWGKHQTLDTFEKKRERDRLYQAERRAAQRALAEKSCDNRLTTDDTSPCVAVSEEDKEEDKEIDRDKRVDCQQVVDLFHSLCPSLSSVRTLTDARKKAIKARLNTYTLDDFKTLFSNAEKSSFLKGANDRNWTATFDWLIKDANMAKVLEGNYADKPKRNGRKEVTPHWCMDDVDESVLKYRPVFKSKTAAEDDEIKARAEALQEKLKGC